MSYSVTHSTNTVGTTLPNSCYYYDYPYYTPPTIYPTITYVQSPCHCHQCHCDCHQKHTEDKLDELITELTKLKEEIAKNKKSKK